MKQEDKKYEEWLTEIKNKQPILENPEELTAAILNKITDNAPKKKKIRYRLRLVMRRQRRNLSRMFSERISGSLVLLVKKLWQNMLNAWAMILCLL